MEAWAIVVAGGQGRRFGQAKQYATIAGLPVLELAVEPARLVCAGVVVVVPGPDAAKVRVDGAVQVVAGGDTRSASVRAGLAAVPASADVIAVHDAARPLARAELWAAVIEAVAAGADGAIPALPLGDTVKHVVGGVVAGTVDRSDLMAVQTPQAFRAALLRRAYASGADATDDAALVEAAGGRVTVVAGAPDNLKITFPADLVVAEALLAARGPGLAGETTE